MQRSSKQLNREKSSSISLSFKFLLEERFQLPSKLEEGEIANRS